MMLTTSSRPHDFLPSKKPILRMEVDGIFAEEPSPITPPASAHMEGHSHATCTDNRSGQTTIESFSTGQPQASPSEISVFSELKPSNQRVRQLQERPNEVLRTPSADTSTVTTPSSTPDPVKPPPPKRTRSKNDRARRKAEVSQREEKERRRKMEEALEKKMTPSEYALKLHSKFQEQVDKNRVNQRFHLEGKRIFFVGGDLNTASDDTRKKMEFVSMRALPSD